MIDLKSSDLVTQIEALKNKEISSYELTSMYLKNIQDNENLNCFISINAVSYTHLTLPTKA